MTNITGVSWSFTVRSIVSSRADWPREPQPLVNSSSVVQPFANCYFTVTMTVAECTVAPDVAVRLMVEMVPLLPPPLQEANAKTSKSRARISAKLSRREPFPWETIRSAMSIAHIAKTIERHNSSNRRVEDGGGADGIAPALTT